MEPWPYSIPLEPRKYSLDELEALQREGFWYSDKLYASWVRWIVVDLVCSLALVVVSTVIWCVGLNALIFALTCGLYIFQRGASHIRECSKQACAKHRSPISIIADLNGGSCR